jgi:hypothetical protein
LGIIFSIRGTNKESIYFRIDIDASGFAIWSQLLKLVCLWFHMKSWWTKVIGNKMKNVLQFQLQLFQLNLQPQYWQRPRP